MSRKSYAILFAVVIFLTGVFTYFVVSNSDAQDNNPKTLIGDWRQTDKEVGTGFTAEITESSIQINYSERDGSGGIFWLGTFDGTHKSTGSFKVKSLPDQDALANALLASNEKIKTFTYNNGVISFDFSVMKMHTTVHMEKK